MDSRQAACWCWQYLVVLRTCELDVTQVTNSKLTAYRGLRRITIYTTAKYLTIADNNYASAPLYNTKIHDYVYATQNSTYFRWKHLRNIRASWPGHHNDSQSAVSPQHEFACAVSHCSSKKIAVRPSYTLWSYTQLYAFCLPVCPSVPTGFVTRKQKK